MKKTDWSSAARLEISRLLDGEPLERFLPDLDGSESVLQVLALLKMVKDGRFKTFNTRARSIDYWFRG